jgi:hypothetical protein
VYGGYTMFAKPAKIKDWTKIYRFPYNLNSEFWKYTDVILVK